jgi:hypothetical protein
MMVNDHNIRLVYHRVMLYSPKDVSAPVVTYLDVLTVPDYVSITFYLVVMEHWAAHTL